MSKESVYPGDFDVESFGTLSESQITDAEQGRSPFDDTKVEMDSAQPTTSVNEYDPVLPIAVTLPPKRLKTVVVGTMLTNAGSVILLAENMKRQRALIQVVTNSVTVYLGEQTSNATLSSGYTLDSTMPPLELWGYNAIYASASADAQVRCLIEYEVK